MSVGQIFQGHLIMLTPTFKVEKMCKKALFKSVLKSALNILIVSLNTLKMLCHILERHLL